MKEAATQNQIRLRLAMALLGLMALAVLARFAYLMMLQPGTVAEVRRVPVERGKILDRNGKVLAFDVPKYDVAVSRSELDATGGEQELREVASLLGLDPAAVIQKVKNSSANFVYLARRMDSEKTATLREQVEEGKFPGIIVDEVSGRMYPEGRLASHLIGFTGEGNRGLEGIELQYERELAGSEGDAAGNDVSLTIDATLQYALEKLARNAWTEHQAEAVFITAIDVNTGELLAYVQMPDFDPNAFGVFTDLQRQDRLSIYTYEPGSVFKVFSMASILDMGLITPQTTFTCDGAYRKVLPSGQSIVIKCLHNHGPQNLSQILANSCNAGVGYASDRISEAELYRRLTEFGFGQKTGMGSIGESPGMIRKHEQWSGRTKPTVAIGQEIRVTALQMMNAAAAVANGGVLLKPATVKKIASPDGVVRFEHRPTALRRVISADTSRAILTAMESAASLDGTGWRAKVPDVRMAVKTGTAQMIDPQTKAYSETDYIASTLGILPADNPRLAIYVAIVKPRGASYLGGKIAAPLLREAAEAALRILGLPRGKSQNVSHDGVVRLTEPPAAVIGTTMPDLRGYSKRQLLPLLLRDDLDVALEGEGYVVEQDPAPGTPVAAGTKIILRLQ